MRVQGMAALTMGALLLNGAFGVGCGNNQAQVSKALLDAFPNNCSIKGRWTDEALGMNRAIVGVFRTLANQDACQLHHDIIRSNAALGQSLEELMEDSSFTEYRRKEEALQQLNLARMTAGASSDLAAALDAEIVKAEIELAHARAADESQHFTTSSLRMGRYLQTLMSQSRTLTSCLQQQPAEAVSLATNLAAFGSSFASPLLGLGVGALSGLIQMGIDLVRQAPTEQAIWQSYENELPLALSCGMESMTELYCQAADAKSLIRLQAQHYPQQGSVPHPIWKGIDFIGRRLPVLAQWLTDARNGIVPTDPLEAQRQNTVWHNVNRVEEIGRRMSGNLSDLRLFIRNSGGNAEIVRDRVTQEIVNYAYWLSSHEAGGGPFASANGDAFSFACWFTVGFAREACPNSSRYDISRLNNYVATELGSHISLERLEANWLLILARVRRMVDIDFSRTINVDPASVFARARTPWSGSDTNPYEALHMLRDYLVGARQRAPSDDLDFIGYVEESIELVNEVIAITTPGWVDPEAQASSELPRPEPSPTAPAEHVDRLNSVARIRALFLKLQLRQGLQYVNSRVLTIVQTDIERMIRSGDLPDEPTSILRSTTGDIWRRLLGEGTLRLQAAMGDINSAQSMLEGELRVFREFFRASIGRSIRKLYRQARESGEPAYGPDRPNGESLAHLCAMVTIVFPEWPSDVPWEMCRGARVESVYQDFQREVTLDVAELRSRLDGQPYGYRVCAYHRYLRAVRIAEALRQNRDTNRARDFIAQMSQIVSRNFEPTLQGRFFGVTHTRPQEPGATAPVRSSIEPAQWQRGWTEVTVFPGL